jgi:1-acyl-sn-glycerol-3-phosphate acyltransferase
VRRAVVDPLFVPVVVVLVVLLAAVVVVSTLVASFSPRRRVLRLASLALTYLLLDASLLLRGTALWLRHPVRRSVEAERSWTAAHCRLLRWALVRLMGAAESIMGFRVDVHPDAPRMVDDGRPVVLLARHAGPGDSFSLVWLILVRLGRTPRVVLKDVLLWDPGLDVVLTRLSGCFLSSRSGAGDDNTDRVAATAAELGTGDALLLFPEGGNWTPGRQRRAVRRLWRSGRRRAARQAAGMPQVLPPRPAGTAAVLAARTDVDIVVVAHAGLDRLTSVRQVWRGIPVDDTPMRVHWWRVPAADVPRAEDEVPGWLNAQWARVARWVAAGPAPVGPAMSGAAREPAPPR